MLERVVFLYFLGHDRAICKKNVCYPSYGYVFQMFQDRSVAIKHISKQ